MFQVRVEWSKNKKSWIQLMLDILNYVLNFYFKQYNIYYVIPFFLSVIFNS